MTDTKQSCDGHHTGPKYPSDLVTTDIRPDHSHDEREPERRHIKISLGHYQSGRNEPVRHRQHRDVEEQNSEADYRLFFADAESKEDRRCNHQQSQPRIPIARARERDRIEVVVPGDVEWGY